MQSVPNGFFDDENTIFVHYFWYSKYSTMYSIYCTVLFTALYQITDFITVHCNSFRAPVYTAVKLFVLNIFGVQHCKCQVSIFKYCIISISSEYNQEGLLIPHNLKFLLL